MIVRIASIVVLILFYFYSFAQKAQEKDANVASLFFDDGEYYQSIVYAGKSYDRKPQLKEALILAQSYEKLRDFGNAHRWYKIVVDRHNMDAYLIDAGRMAIARRRYKDAERDFYAYQRYFPEDTLVNVFLTSCDSIKEWSRQKPKYDVRNLKKLNSPFSDIAPTGQGDSLVFCSTREGTVIMERHGQTNEPFYNLFLAVLDSTDELKKITRFSDQINSLNHEGPSCIAGGFKTIYFTRSEHTQGKNLNKSESNLLKLYKSEKVAGRWKKPLWFVLNDSTVSVAHPSISKDGNAFFFSSDMPGGFGGTDLYVCFKNDSVWTKPLNLGPEINTPGNEEYPFIFDEKTLYFSSDSHVGYGGYDLYKSQLVGEKWIVENLKAPINSSYDDFGLWQRTADSGCFTSNRPGGKGKEDIYTFHLK